VGDRKRHGAAMGTKGSLSLRGWESSRGENHRTAKLTDDDVRQIRRLFGTMPHKDIAAKFGVHKSVISHIKTRKRWSHVV